MRTVMILALAALNASCAHDPASCEDSPVPASAHIVRSHGADFAFHPKPLPPSFVGCQRTWIGDADEPESMRLMSTAFFVGGTVHWLTANEPGGRSFRCVYQNHVLNEAESTAPTRCPAANELEDQ